MPKQYLTYIKPVVEMTEEEFVRDPVHRALAAISETPMAKSLPEEILLPLLGQFQLELMALTDEEMRERYQHITKPGVYPEMLRKARDYRRRRKANGN